MSAPVRARLAWLALATAAAALPACFDRAPCLRDSECAPDLCYYDGQCLPRDLAARAGRAAGGECLVDAECRYPGRCQTGWCAGELDAGPVVDTTPPVFAGAQGVDSDGDGVLLVYWGTAIDDTTVSAAIDFLVYRGDGAAVDWTAPVATVTGLAYHRDPGLAPGATYTYGVRARDLPGNLSAPGDTVSATAQLYTPPPPGVDFATEILPILQERCVLCHGGASGLYLDTHAGLLTGGVHGPAVVPCDPAASNLASKIGPTPPFGLRMPRTGPPFLPYDQQATITRWIADGAAATYTPGACP